MIALHKRAVIACVLCAVTGCAANGLLFHSGPRPPELTGIWIDVEKTTPTDTSAWMLEPGGGDITLHLTVRADSAGRPRVERRETRFGSWYLAGAISDTAGRAE